MHARRQVCGTAVLREPAQDELGAVGTFDPAPAPNAARLWWVGLQQLGLDEEGASRRELFMHALERCDRSASSSSNPKEPEEM